MTKDLPYLHPVRKTPRPPWVAQIKVFGRAYHLGSFPTIDEAIAARQGADKLFDVLHGHTGERMATHYSMKAGQRARAKEVQEKRK